MRRIDETLFEALVRGAEATGRTVEEEYRAILSGALRKVYNRQFVRTLLSIPDVGEDSDVEGVSDKREASVVVDWNQRHHRDSA
ncbi:DNA-binding protein [Paraburkholderia lacunae]|uniref:DNA-binding protein n=2 Tax=Paraburkholderia lacunae TaxID=2211104 RepID=A0A370N9V2_9BURK|nr:DNA-binding protein [Paraburkholderia lacunae]